MKETVASSELSQLTTAEFTRYFRHLAATRRKGRALDHRGPTLDQAVPVRQQHRPPHLASDRQPQSLHRFDRRRLWLRPAPRTRVHRPVHYPLEKLLAEFQQAVEMVVRTLEAQTDATFAIPVPDQSPIQTRLGLFLVCAAHLNNHIGQMSYLVQALQASTKEPPVW